MKLVSNYVEFVSEFIKVILPFSTVTKHYLSILALEMMHLVPYVIISIRKVLMSFPFVLVMLPKTTLCYTSQLMAI